ncbi:MAG: hypothetical protein IJT34_02790 [Butyrivibrio sp.]|nr:hypothetical protein [Butyrivibrio sp.]
MSSSVCFIAEANEHVASGHVIRCRTIAGELPHFGWEGHLGQPSGTDVWIFVDSYDADTAYYRRLRANYPGARLAAFDDLGRIDYTEPALVDLVVNYDPAPDPLRYSGVPQSLLGPSYAPLRHEFRDRDYHVHSTVHRVLLTSGATDRYGWKLALLDRIMADHLLPEVELCTVIGSMEDRSPYESLAMQLPRLRLFQNVTEMAALMLSCDLAITGAGNTLYELCALGLPLIIRPGSDWETTFAQEMGDTLGAPCVSSDEALLQAMMKLTGDPAARNSLSEQGHRLSDGRGAERIARALTESCPSSIVGA